MPRAAATKPQSPRTEVQAIVDEAKRRRAESRASAERQAASDFRHDVNSRLKDLETSVGNLMKLLGTLAATVTAALVYQVVAHFVHW